MNQILLYCRRGYEKECAAEIQDRASEMGLFGFAKAKNESAYVLFECHQQGHALKLLQHLEVRSLIFARQMILVAPELKNLPVSDRITPLMAALPKAIKAGRLWVETPDTDQAKELAKFCRKITVPLRQALRSKGALLVKENEQRPVIHVCFTATDSAFVGYSLTQTHALQPMGIMRLKMPAEAPSRSTLKLDEAFHVFIPKDEQEKRLAPGMNAVDLGACPGGWTYQLVRRSMRITAVDHGSMAPAMMDTGQVKHVAQDGFTYEPPRKNVYWLVCDMVDKPARVAQLMERWAISGWCVEAIFNLKLPMKSRYKDVIQILGMMDEVLRDAGLDGFVIQCKHLYHDRDEVTVHLDLRHAQWVKNV
jgi:23S rRNA (cytidine2498-2'-O)-methyltransferase